MSVEMWAGIEEDEGVRLFRCDDEHLLPGAIRNGAAEAALAGIPFKYLCIRNGRIEKKTVEKIAAIDAAEAQAIVEAQAKAEQAAAAQEAARASAIARETARLLEIHRAYNEYILFCNEISGTTDNVPLSIPQLEAIGAQIAGVNPEAAKDAQLKLLAIDAKLKTLDGLSWWNRCVWTDGI